VNAGKVNIKKIQFFDLRGRLILEQDNIHAIQARFDIGNVNQVLIVKVTSETNETVIKKIVN